MKDKIESLFIASEKMKGSTMSLLRCLILTMLHYYKDGLQFRELQTVCHITDGKLIYNLKQLIEFKYIEKSKIIFDNKTLSIYCLTEDGKKEVEKMGDWMETVIEIIKTK